MTTYQFTLFSHFILRCYRKANILLGQKLKNVNFKTFSKVQIQHKTCRFSSTASFSPTVRRGNVEDTGVPQSQHDSH